MVPSAVLLCVPFLGLFPSVLNSLLWDVLHMHLDSLTVPLFSSFRVGSLRKLTRNQPMPSTFCVSQAIRRDQVCHISNEGGCLIKHPRLAICKPDSFVSLTAPSCRFFYKQDVQLSPRQSEIDSNCAATLSGGKNFASSVWTFLTFLNLQTSFEKEVNMSSTKVDRLSEGIRFAHHKKWMFE